MGLLKDLMSYTNNTLGIGERQKVRLILQSTEFLLCIFYLILLRKSDLQEEDY